MSWFGKKKTAAWKKKDKTAEESSNTRIAAPRQMMKINLLPWRDELRKERETRFAAATGIAVAASAIIFLLVHLYIAGLINYQNRRNDYLNEEIKKADEKIEQIKELKKKREQLYNRMEVIQKLQASRPEVVHLFDELVKQLPSGVYFTGLAQKNRTITINGVAQSQASISTLMRKLDGGIPGGSEWFKDVKLVVIKTVEQGGKKESQFTLQMEQPSQNTEEESAKKDKNAKDKKDKPGNKPTEKPKPTSSSPKESEKE